MGVRRILVLGISGMLGHTLFAQLVRNPELQVYGSIRTERNTLTWLPSRLWSQVYVNVDVNNLESLLRVIAECRPELIVNCIGAIKQKAAGNDPLTAIAVNSLLPHRLALICEASGIRLMHISTDCVFDGLRGNYCESDAPNPLDLYGRTKVLGEVVDGHCLTLRTSVIGHEIRTKYGLVEWFLAQEGPVAGYAKVMYSGLPTVELARIIDQYVIPREDLRGLYHVSSEPISKDELLNQIASQYNKKIRIEPEENTRLNRVLDSTLFRNLTGYIPPSWPELVKVMYQDFQRGWGREENV